MCDGIRIALDRIVGSSTKFLTCYTGTNCSPFPRIDTDVICTDYHSDIRLDYSSGECVDIIMLSLNWSLPIGFDGYAWMPVARV